MRAGTISIQKVVSLGWGSDHPKLLEELKKPKYQGKLSLIQDAMIFFIHANG